MVPRLKAAGILMPTLLAVPALVVLLGLGTWQVERKAWKDGLLQAIETRLREPAADIAGLIHATGPERDIEYKRVRARGHFIHAAEQLLWVPDPKLGPGYHVYTPLLLGNGRHVIVNRGFVDAAHRDRATRSNGLPTGGIEVIGLARRGERPGAFSPQRDSRTGVWYWRDLPGMSRAALGNEAASALAFFVEAEASPSATGTGPKGGATRLTLPNRHLEYALTWYGLAMTLVGVWLAFVISRLKAAASPTRSEATANRSTR